MMEEMMREMGEEVVEGDREIEEEMGEEMEGGEEILDYSNDRVVMEVGEVWFLELVGLVEQARC